MKPKQLLEETAHRPWELPQEGWKFYQEWNEAVFLHWQVDLRDLRKHVPEEIEIDLFEGKPWVSLVFFNMANIRPRFLPAFAPVSDFYELNIRTYVRSGNKTGVYFLSMEGSKWLSCTVSRLISELPYRFSTMSRTANSFKSNNAEFKDHISASYRVGVPIKDKEDLVKWLSERYALIQDAGDSINQFEVHHLEWPMQALEIKELKLSYPRFEKLMAGKPHLQQYSSGVQVLAWGKEKILRKKHIAIKFPD
jgi:uncharacterized protein YqjF (DUF2071 family)